MTELEIRTAFSDWLKAQLEERGWNYSRLAREVGVRESNARSWVLGGNLPDWHNCRDLAVVLGVPREEVRRRRGYVDPDEAEPTPVGEKQAQLAALIQSAEEEELDMLLHIARLQRFSPRHKGQGRKG